ncbi:hypothetical protein [Sinorhizobium meliloti]|uniref:hypothetical protein n=1 Tax=Rhizobium meliloti TaxID=382 RepID=UPI000FD8A9DC|nr:hypothetical protein [Sinorhizobium meliloti]RVQ55718.1 hypothetical protein CN060_20940 [Sinorhizobium meliloti]
MAKNSVRDWDATAANNTDIAGIGIQGTNLPSNFDNAFRTIMGQIADVNAGAQPINDTWTYCDPADSTKRFRFDAGSISTASTRVVTLPDASFTIGSTSGANVPFMNGVNTWSATQTFTEIVVDPASSGAFGVRIKPSDTSSGRLFLEATTHTWSSYVQESTGDLLFGNGGTYGSSSGTTQARITSTGGFTINGDFLAGGSLTVGNGAVSGSAASPTVSFGSSIGIYRVSDAIRFTYSGSAVADITASGIRLPSNMAVSFSGTGAATTRTNLGLGALAVLDFTGLVYTGSDNTNADFPIGTVVAARDSTANRAGSATIYLRVGTNTSFTANVADGVPGSALTGTWRQRGRTVDADAYALYQRTA